MISPENNIQKGKILNYIQDKGLGVVTLVAIATILYLDRQALWKKVDNIELYQKQFMLETIEKNTETLNEFIHYTEIQKKSK